MMKTAQGLVAWVRSKLGAPYWYGCFGQIGDAALLEYKRKQWAWWYNENRIARCKGQYGKQVFDCVGLIKGYLWENGGKIGYNATQDKSADGMLAACAEKGAIGTIPEIPGTLVFQSGHVGVYIGNGQVIECTGDIGVRQTSLPARWTHWGKCPFIDYSGTGNNAPSTGYAAGSQITLSDAALYGQSTAAAPVNHLTGKYFIYDGIDVNGRYRITNSATNVRKTPMGKYVTGYVSKAEIK